MQTRWKRVILIPGAFFIVFLYFFFAKHDLISLRNMPTKFREAALGRYGAMCKLDGKGLY